MKNKTISIFMMLVLVSTLLFGFAVTPVTAYTLYNLDFEEFYAGWNMNDQENLTYGWQSYREGDDSITIDNEYTPSGDYTLAFDGVGTLENTYMVNANIYYPDIMSFWVRIESELPDEEYATILISNGYWQDTTEYLLQLKINWDCSVEYYIGGTWFDLANDVNIYNWMFFEIDYHDPNDVEITLSDYRYNPDFIGPYQQIQIIANAINDDSNLFEISDKVFLNNASISGTNYSVINWLDTLGSSYQDDVDWIFSLDEGGVYHSWNGERATNFNDLIYFTSNQAYLFVENESFHISGTFEFEWTLDATLTEVGHAYHLDTNSDDLISAYSIRINSSYRTLYFDDLTYTLAVIPGGAPGGTDLSTGSLDILNADSVIRLTDYLRYKLEIAADWGLSTWEIRNSTYVLIDSGSVSSPFYGNMQRLLDDDFSAGSYYLRVKAYARDWSDSSVLNESFTVITAGDGGYLIDFLNPYDLHHVGDYPGLLQFLPSDIWFNISLITGSTTVYTREVKGFGEPRVEIYCFGSFPSEGSFYYEARYSTNSTLFCISNSTVSVLGFTDMTEYATVLSPIFDIYPVDEVITVTITKTGDAIGWYELKHPNLGTVSGASGSFYGDNVMFNFTPEMKGEYILYVRDSYGSNTDSNADITVIPVASTGSDAGDGIGILPSLGSTWNMIMGLMIVSFFTLLPLLLTHMTNQKGFNFTIPAIVYVLFAGIGALISFAFELFQDWVLFFIIAIGIIALGILYLIGQRQNVGG